MQQMLLEDRRDAGRQLAARLRHHGYADRSECQILALPRGGAPVAFEIAQDLNLPMGVLPVKKVGAPDQEELAIGAVTLDGIHYINHELVSRLDIDEDMLNLKIQAKEEEVAQQNRLFNADKPTLNLAEQSVILVDDGLATGATMNVAIEYAREQSAREIVVAVPVAARDTVRELEADQIAVFTLATPEPFRGVGMHYMNFEQVANDEVQRFLELSPPDITVARPAETASG